MSDVAKRGFFVLDTIPDPSWATLFDRRAGVLAPRLPPSETGPAREFALRMVYSMEDITSSILYAPHMAAFTTSPAVEAVRRALARGDQTATASFWKQVAERGAPLVELSSDPQERLVTFLWRDGGDTENVLLSGGPATWDAPMEQNLLEHLNGSDIWFKTQRLPADARFSYQLSPNDPLTPAAAVSDWPARLEVFQPDPLNPRRLVRGADPDSPAARPREYSLVELPDGAPERWHEPCVGVPTGRVRRYSMRSRKLGNQRRIWIYTPPGYTTHSETRYPLLVLFDGARWAHELPVATTLDNLIQAGQVPPLVAALVDSIDEPTRDRELACNDLFEEFVVAELLPWVDRHARTSADRRERIIAGQSLGALAATFIAFRHPDMFSKVLAQSGSFWWPAETPFNAGAERMAREFALSPRLDLRFYQEVGRLEPERLRAPNRHLRNVLWARGYEVHYREFSGGHDYAHWQVSLATGLCHLFTA